jgi:uncharacterized membrane protein YeiH
MSGFTVTASDGAILPIDTTGLATQTMNELIYWIGMAAVASNAASGALEAGRRPTVDLFGAVVVGLATAVGGGSLRDLLLDRSVFWIADQTYLFVAIGAAVAASLADRLSVLPSRLFLIADAIGLALFTVIGTRIAMAAGTPWFAATFLGVVTGAFGGVLRDVLRNEVPIVFSSELYATAAWAGALSMVGMQQLSVSLTVQAIVAGAIVFGLRMGGIRYGWKLPLARKTAVGESSV